MIILQSTNSERLSNKKDSRRNSWTSLGRKKRRYFIGELEEDVYGNKTDQVVVGTGRIPKDLTGKIISGSIRNLVQGKHLETYKNDQN